METSPQAGAADHGQPARRPAAGTRAGRLIQQHGRRIFTMLLLLSIVLNVLLWRRVQRLETDHSWLLSSLASDIHLQISSALGNIDYALEALTEGDEQQADDWLLQARAELAQAFALLQVYSTATNAPALDMAALILSYQHTVNDYEHERETPSGPVVVSRAEALPLIRHDLQAFLDTFPERVLVQGDHTENQRRLQALCDTLQFTAFSGGRSPDCN